MIKCKNGECPKGKDMCCFSCDEREACNDVCDLDVETCGKAIHDEGDQEAAMVEFQQGQLAVLQQIANVVTQKKKLEDQEAELKEKLKKAMEVHGVKKFESEILNITYIAATTATSIDSPKLKKKYPEIAAECSKTSNKSAYVKVTVK
jgi:hypothetical protein